MKRVEGDRDGHQLSVARAETRGQPQAASASDDAAAASREIVGMPTHWC